MSSIDTSRPGPLATAHNKLVVRAADADAAASPAPTDSYEKSAGKAVIPLPKGAYKFGEFWVMPPDSLTRLDRQDPLTGRTEIDFSASAILADDGSAELNAQFKAILSTHAVAYSELERNIHKLLGFTVETHKTTLSLSGELSARALLADGTFFDTSFSAYAASYSIMSKYTFDSNFQAQYGMSPVKTVENNFTSLQAMVESLVLKATPGGNFSTFFHGEG